MKLDLDRSKLFFTADLHFDQENIIKYYKRPFRNKEEMNEILVQNWNKKVPIDGIVFLIGNVGCGDSSDLRRILDRLNGKIFFIEGNYDAPAKNQKCIGRFEIFNSSTKERFRESFLLSVPDKDAKDGIQKIHLLHYPLIDWKEKFKGSWHLHGYSHQNVVQSAIGNLLYKNKIIDIGVDGHNFSPVSYEEIKIIMTSKNE